MIKAQSIGLAVSGCQPISHPCSNVALRPHGTARDDAVEALLANGPDEALDVRVEIGAAAGKPGRPGTRLTEHLSEFASEDGAAVLDHPAGCRFASASQWHTTGAGLPTPGCPFHCEAYCVFACSSNPRIVPSISSTYTSWYPARPLRGRMVTCHA